MKQFRFLLLALLYPAMLTAQNVEIHGSAKIMQADTSNDAKFVVVRGDDGTIAVREASTLAIPKFQVGDWAHGGIVIWVDNTGRHGLVCAKVDQHNNVAYSAGTDINTMARGDGPGAGRGNTSIIIASQGFGNGSVYAARVCNEAEITEDGVEYGDWFMPSLQTLIIMWQNRTVINATAIANGGHAFVNDWYRASTEVDIDEAWCVNLVNGATATAKMTLDRLRAVRAF